MRVKFILKVPRQHEQKRKTSEEKLELRTKQQERKRQKEQRKQLTATSFINIRQIKIVPQINSKASQIPLSTAFGKQKKNQYKKYL